MPDAGPIRRNDAKIEFPGGVIRQLRHRARAGPAVAKHHRFAVRVAIFRHGDGAAALQLNNFWMFRHGCGLDDRITAE